MFFTTTTRVTTYKKRREHRQMASRLIKMYVHDIPALAHYYLNYVWVLHGMA